ncbi:MAG: hypothetical protein F7C38_01160 [Desulfurococcales archaeon]|nr:hypothetical protein [Desulfurococcales archaeon]
MTTKAYRTPSQRLALLYSAMCVLYSLTLYMEGQVDGESIYYLTLVASLFTPIIAWTTAKRDAAGRGTSSPRLEAGPMPIYHLLAPPLATFSLLAAVLAVMNPFLLYNRLLWMHIAIVSIQAAYHLLVILLLVRLLEWKPQMIGATALVVFALYPLAVTLGAFGADVSSAWEVVAYRLLLIPSYPALVFSPDQAPPMESMDYSTLTFTVSTLFMALSMLLETALLRTLREPTITRGATVSLRTAASLAAILLLVAAFTGISLYAHAHATGRVFVDRPEQLILVGASRDRLYTIGLVDVSRSVDRSRYPLVLEESGYAIAIYCTTGLPMARRIVPGLPAPSTL